MNRPHWGTGVKILALVTPLMVAGGIVVTVIGAQRETAPVVVAGAVAIILGLRLARPVAQSVIDWLDRRGA